MLDDRKFASVLCCVAALRPVHLVIPALKSCALNIDLDI